MTNLRDEVEVIEPLTQKAKQYIAANLHSLQMARLDTVKNATLEDLFRGKNPYLLLAKGQAAHLLMSQCLDSYLASADEAHFANFSRELATFAARRSRVQLEPSIIIEFFASKRLPLRIELLEEYDRSLHRLLRQFYLQFCDEDATIDWARLTRFVSASYTQGSSWDVVDRIQ